MAPSIPTLLRVPHDGAHGSSLAERFAKADPFPHVVLEDVLAAPSDELLPEFPGEGWVGWQRYRDDYQRGKMICKDIAVMPRAMRDIVEEMSSPRFLAFLEAMTGIDGLLVDPYLEGGGLHASGPGGILAPHTDFHLYPRLGVYRRLNALLYLNPGWTGEDGGCLELWRSEGDTMPAARVIPRYGTLVVFRTDHGSVHGFSTPVREGLTRRSIALYYYTATEAAQFSGDTNTYWRRHGEGGGVVRGARLAAYRSLLFGSRALSYVAHRANPNLGSRVRPD